LDLLNQTKYFCKLCNIRPNSLLGQNFLISEDVLDSIESNILDLNKNNILNVVEIGGGFGFLTNKLIKIFSKVLVIEKDKTLYAGLEKNQKSSSEMEISILLDDALNIYKKSYLERKIVDYFNNQKYCFIANIPYSITSRLIRNLLELDYKPEFLMFMVQKEVAERICAKTGSMSLLSIACQFYADCKILFYVDKTSFYPSPRVDSAILYLKIKEVPNINIDNFFRVCKIGFSARRKKLISNLSNGFEKDKIYFEEIFSKMNLDENIRAQDLSIEDWIELCYNIYV
jgi:16S rRNA (adenine1518-N6/adenine1519-N6)-dimethyltransferase